MPIINLKPVHKSNNFLKLPKICSTLTLSNGSTNQTIKLEFFLVSFKTNLITSFLLDLLYNAYNCSIIV